LAWDEDTIDNPAAKPDLGTRQPVSFGERYSELRELGFNDLQILGKFKIKAESLVRQIERYGFKASPELVSLACSRKHHRRAS
jgi:hypothetical protein